VLNAGKRDVAYDGKAFKAVAMAVPVVGREILEVVK
jgi:hypothetical protein